MIAFRKSRTDKRSRSGAGTPCPHCGKLLRGNKGAKMHAGVCEKAGAK